MKGEKKTNCEHLMDEIAHLDDDAIAECMMMEVPGVRSSVKMPSLRRRAFAAGAACLAAFVITGGILTVPLLKPAETEKLGTNQGSAFFPSVSVPGENDSIVRVQMLSVEEEEIGSLVTPEQEEGHYDKHILLNFELAEGESVSILSHDPNYPDNDRLSQALTVIEDEDIESDVYRQAIRQIKLLIRKATGPKRTAMVDEDTFLWGIPRNSELTYDVVEFMILDAAGQPVGAGSVCIGMKQLSAAYALLRYNVLGAVRYDAPVSEEKALSDIQAFSATAEAVYKAMDFSPQNVIEGYHIAEYQLEKDYFSEVKAMQSFLCRDGWSEFAWYTAEVRGTEEKYRFILGPDGNYYEISDAGAALYDMLLDLPTQEDWWDTDTYLADVVLPLTDGRQMTFVKKTVSEYNKETERKVEKWFIVIEDAVQPETDMASV